MMSETYTIPTLYERIRRVMTTRGIPADQAIPIVHAELAHDPAELVRCWSSLGAVFLKLLEEEIWRQGGPTKMRVPTPVGPLPPLPSASAMVPAAPRSRTVRASSWRDAASPLDMLMPVGATGVKKRLGDFNREDVLAVAEHYTANGRKMMEAGQAWTRTAERMEEGETLERALQRIPVEERGDLPVKLHSARNIPSGMPAAPTAGSET